MTNGPVISFHVRGAGQFPIDMLRYDAAWPASERDSALIGERGRRTVRLNAYCPNGRRMDVPTVGRWESFLWQVIADEDVEP